ncbi:MAG: hypothetical protein CR984_05985 [Proteobacteria bacterium]|nr:MAG: hypothetical protein CR984_05985 [Pseudomonadota bacterium]PIE67550.1 MAG: hypothetical protein CSA23_03750 [Deltaproteobacteria bacterium]
MITVDAPRQLRQIDQIVADILASMSLKEKALIANMNEKSLPYLQYAFDVYLTKEAGNDPKSGQAIMKRLWQTLHDTHRIRIVSGEEKSE